MYLPYSQDPVVITGLGAVCPDAVTLPELLSTLQSPARAPADCGVVSMSRYNPQDSLGKHGWKYLTPATRYALSSANFAFEDAGIRDQDYLPEERGVILGTNFADHGVMRDMDRVVLTMGAEMLQPMEAPNFSINIPASRVAIKHQLRACNLTLTNTFIAGIESLILATQSIASGRAQMILAGATDAPPPLLAEHLGGEVAEGAACVMCLEKKSRSQGRTAYGAIGSSALRFIPSRQLETAAGHATLAALCRKFVSGIPLPEERPLALVLFHGNFALARYANEALAAALAARAVSTVQVNAPRRAPAEACVSPLLALAAALIRYGEAIVLATSPQGHLALLHIKHAKE